MKAVVFENHGDVDALEWREWPDPVPAADEVLIRVQATSFNGFEPMVLRGISTLKTPLPMIPGADVAGEVISAGPEVPAGVWRPGDRVLVMPLQVGRGMMGETLHGGFCERLAVPYQYLIRIPESVSFTQAAALPVAYGTAYRMIMTRGRVSAGERILILGATGGVGTCCVQLAKICGAEVIACTSSAEKAERLKDLGADHVINTSTHDFVDECIRKFGKPRVFGPGAGVDVVINYIGGASWAKSLRVIRRGGRMLTCGASDGYDPKTDIRYIWSYEIDIQGSNAWSMDDIEAVLKLVSDGKLIPVIHVVRPMKEARTSMREFIDRNVFGKSILVP